MEELLERSEIPFEDVDPPFGLFLGQPKEEAAERLALAMLIGIERDTRVEVPADDEDALVGLLHRGPDDAIIVCGVDDDARLAGASDPPAVASFLDYRPQIPRHLTLRYRRVTIAQCTDRDERSPRR